MVTPIQHISFPSDVSIVCHCFHIVLNLNPLGEQGKWHLHVLVIFKAHHQIKVFDVQAHISGVRCADYTIPVYFGCVQVCCANGWARLICDEVTPGRDTNPIGILLLRSIIHDWIAVSDFFVLSQDMFDFIMCHDKHSVGPFLTSFVIALRHTTEVLPKRNLPYFRCRRIVHHFFVNRNGLTSHWVYHW